MKTIKQQIKKLINRLWGTSYLASQEDRRDRDYRIQEIFISLPFDHLLPEYQMAHKRYDKFLTYLARFLPAKSLVVDVGANCGDTLAAMIQANRQLSFLCIEGDDTFYEYLLHNISRIKHIVSDASILAVKAFAGMNISNVSLTGSGGTKKASVLELEGATGLQAETLDSIILNSDIDPASISLLKTDTDGYDFDVIESAGSLLKGFHPFIFFECQFDSDSQKNEFLRIIDWLDGIGYCSWVVFDNFGCIITSSKDASQVSSLIEYVWLQNQGHTTRTIHYIDILACGIGNTGIVEQVINGYNLYDCFNPSCSAMP